MRIRSRFVRVLLICLLVLLFAGYFAFSTFVFSPTEDDYDADVATLVPRDVDFFVAKSDLRGDFSKFPRLKLQDELEQLPAWSTWIGSPEYAAFEQQNRIEAQLAEVEAQLQQVGVDPLEAFGGEDFAIAGYFRGPTLEQSDWAAYGRCTWMGKLAVAALAYPGLIGLDQRGIQADSQAEHVALSGTGLPRPMYVTRIRDVVVAGTSRELVLKALDLQARGGQESFGLSAIYNDHIARAHRTLEGDDVEVYCDWRALSEKLHLSGRWPDPQADQPFMGLFARLFQLGTVRSLAGTVGFDRGVIVDAHAELSSETMTPFQKSLYRQRGRESAQIVQQVARIARPDSYVVAHLEADFGDLMREAYASLDAATRQLLDDTLRSTGQFNNAAALIQELDTLFRGRFALIVRDHDYPAKPDDPPHNDVPVPAITVMLWIEGGEKSYARVKELQRLVSDNQGRFGLQGRGGGKGVFINTLSGGFEVWEFWNPFIDGTGHIAVSRDGDRYFLSNSYAMLNELLNRSITTSNVERLSDQPQFTQLVAETLPASNLFLWVNPRTMAKTLRTFAERDAVDQVVSRLDLEWPTVRPAEEEKAIRELFPGKQRGQLSPEEQAQVNEAVNPVLDAYKERRIRELGPELRAEMERQIAYFEVCAGLLLTVALDPKTIDVALSVLVPMEEARE